MVQLLFPNIAGTAMQGFQQGQNMRANRLIGLAMQNPDQSQQYLGQAATINPTEVMQVQDAQARNQYMQGMQQQLAQKNQQAQQEMMAKKAGAAARYWKAAMQTGNPAAKAAAAQAVIPFLSEMAAKQGKPPPTAQDLESPQALAGLDRIIASTAYLFPQDKPIAVGSDTTLIDPNTHQVIYQGQGDAGVPVPGMTFNGMPVFRDKLGGLKDIRGNPIPSQGESNGASVGAPVSGPAAGAAPQAPTLGQAADPSLIDGNVPKGTQVTQASGPDGTRVLFAMAPHTADAVKTQTAAVAGLPQPTPQGQAGGLQYAPKGHVRTLSPAEVKAAGLPEGTVAQQGPDGKISIVSKPGGQNGPAQVFGDTTKTGDAYLQTLDPAMQRQVLALDQGRMQFPSSFALKTPYWQGLLQAVGQYDPTFDAVNYNSRNQTRRNFTAGKEAQQVNALNTVAQHLAQLQQDANALNNAGGFPFATTYNWITNAYENREGDPRLANFKRDRLPVIQELERVWRGTGGNASDIQEWTNNLSSSSSQQQFNDAFAHIANLIHGKLSALRDQYLQGMGNTHDAYQFLTPSTRAIFESLGGAPVGSETVAPGEGSPQAANQAPQSAAQVPAPGTVEQGYRFKGGDPSNQANWEPVQ